MVTRENRAVRPEKAETVKEIAGHFTDSEAAILTEYRGLRVAEIAEVRGALRDAGADYKVLKNTLARIAVRDVGLDELVEQLEGPTAVVFVHGDLVEAAKALDDAAKKYPVLLVKGGALKGKLLSAEDARALARLESREILLSKVAMLANSPLQRTINVFAAMLRDLGSMLAQVLTQKETEQPAAAQQPAAEPEPETPAVETGPETGPESETLESPDVGPAPEEGAPAEEPTNVDTQSATQAAAGGRPAEPEGEAPNTRGPSGTLAEADAIGETGAGGSQPRRGERGGVIVEGETVEETAEVQSAGGPVVEGEPPEVKSEGGPAARAETPKGEPPATRGELPDEVSGGATDEQKVEETDSPPTDDEGTVESTEGSDTGTPAEGDAGPKS
ncbi:MAG: 50S ribosomal protein L10 [Actinomycetota bacterium]